MGGGSGALEFAKGEAKRGGVGVGWGGVCNSPSSIRVGGGHLVNAYTHTYIHTYMHTHTSDAEENASSSSSSSSSPSPTPQRRAAPPKRGLLSSGGGEGRRVGCDDRGFVLERRTGAKGG